jgi:hypothetical protein
MSSNSLAAEMTRSFQDKLSLLTPTERSEITKLARSAGLSLVEFTELLFKSLASSERLRALILSTLLEQRLSEMPLAQRELVLRGGSPKGDVSGFLDLFEEEWGEED